MAGASMENMEAKPDAPGVPAAEAIPQQIFFREAKARLEAAIAPRSD